MPRRLFEFVCNSGHLIEKYTDVNTLTLHCAACGDYSSRKVSVPTLPKGVLGHNWAADRAKKQAKEK